MIPLLSLPAVVVRIVDKTKLDGRVQRDCVLLRVFRIMHGDHLGVLDKVEVEALVLRDQQIGGAAAESVCDLDASVR